MSYRLIAPRSEGKDYILPWKQEGWSFQANLPQYDWLTPLTREGGRFNALAVVITATLSHVPEDRPTIGQVTEMMSSSLFVQGDAEDGLGTFYAGCCPAVSIDSTGDNASQLDMSKLSITASTGAHDDPQPGSAYKQLLPVYQAAIIAWQCVESCSATIDRAAYSFTDISNSYDTYDNGSECLELLKLLKADLSCGKQISKNFMRLSESKRITVDHISQAYIVLDLYRTASLELKTLERCMHGRHAEPGQISQASLERVSSGVLLRQLESIF